MSQVRLGELMLASRLIDQDQLQLGLREWRATQEPLSPPPRVGIAMRAGGWDGMQCIANVGFTQLPRPPI